jgi:hypothetical protein
MLCSDCSRPIRPVVAIDIDGTIADYHEHFFEFSKQYLGRRGTGWTHNYHGLPSMAMFMGITKQQYRQLKLAYRQGGMKRSMPMFFHAPELFDMLRNNGVEIWVTTTRPYLQVGNIDEDTREWLRRNQLPYDHILYDERKYKRLTELVDSARIVTVLDDQVEPEIIEAQAFSLNPILLRTKYNWQRVDKAYSIGESNVAWSIRKATAMIQERINVWREANAVGSEDRPGGSEAAGSSDEVLADHAGD